MVEVSNFEHWNLFVICNLEFVISAHPSKISTAFFEHELANGGKLEIAKETRETFFHRFDLSTADKSFDPWEVQLRRRRIEVRRMTKDEDRLAFPILSLNRSSNGSIGKYP